MLFSTTTFVFIFLPAVIVIYYLFLRKSRNAQNTFLFLASLFFYAWGEPFFVLLMILSIIVNWRFGIAVDRAKKAEQESQAKRYIVFMLIFNLGLMFIFKYLHFTMATLKGLTGLELPVPEIALPIGISFFTFQAISYVIDVYGGKGKAQTRLVNVGLYISFFPQLIAGPIVRYQTIADQIEGRKDNFADFSIGVKRFIIGLGKKVLLANTLAIVADRAFDMNGSLSVAMAWLGAIAYTLQIFFDFSGYSDMAIGLGRMFGFHFMENFNYPYISSSISEFWRRWHISLGSWFRDYVYFPLGGSRVDKKSRLVFNLFIVWLLTGIWHGANWTFICWGVFYFVLITIEKLSRFEQKEKKLTVLRHIYTMLFVILGWVMFRADSLSEAVVYLGNMFGSSGCLVDNYASYTLTENWIYFLVGIIASIPVLSKIGSKLEKKPIGICITTAGWLVVFLVTIAYMVKGTYNPFIYFNF